MTIARLSGQDAFGAAAAASVSATYPSGPTDGNSIIAVVQANVGGGIISVDSGFVLVAEATTGTTSCSVWARIASGADTSVVASATGATVMRMHIYEYSGVLNVFVPGVDDFETDASGSGSTSLTIGPIDTVFADDLIFVACSQGNANGGDTAWVTATNLQVGATDRLMCGQYLPAAELAAFSDTASWTTSRIRAGVIVAFKPAITAESSSDTATGTDSESVAATLTDTDTAVATDDGTITADFSDTESGAASELETIAATLADDDTATATDTEALAAEISEAEAAVIAEAEAIIVQVVDSDTASAVDAESVVTPGSGGWLVGASYL